MDFRVISPPIASDRMLALVSAADMKAAERVSHNRENGLIEGLIRVAFEYLHGYHGWTRGYHLLEEEIELFAPSIGAAFEIALRPVLDEDSVVVARRNAQGGYDDLARSDWSLSREDDCAVIDGFSRSAFPAVRVPHKRLYRIRFKAGHAEPGSVPEGLRHSMILLASHWYANREATFPDPRTAPVSREIAYGVKALAGRYQFSADHS